MLGTLEADSELYPARVAWQDLVSNKQILKSIQCKQVKLQHNNHHLFLMILFKEGFCKLSFPFTYFIL